MLRNVFHERNASMHFYFLEARVISAIDLIDRVSKYRKRLDWFSVTRGTSTQRTDALSAVVVMRQLIKSR